MIGARTLVLQLPDREPIRVMLGVPGLLADGQWGCRVHAMSPNLDGIVMVGPTPAQAQERAAWFVRDAVRLPQDWSE